MNARREPVPQAPKTFPPHVFVGNPYGPRDPVRQKPIECSVVVDGRQCKFPKANAVHITSEEIAESLPPTHPDDVSDRIIGEAS